MSNDIERWDGYLRDICIAVSYKSPCLSRKIGAILVRDKSIVATGYNGPPRGVPHCGHERIMKDENLRVELGKHSILPYSLSSECPRRLMGYISGEGLEWCPAQHAEANCISNAARLGVSTIGTTLYMNCIIPCKDCFGKLINAGIVEIVVDDATIYSNHSSRYLIDNSVIKIREFRS
jgi:dCMP deaminase